MVLIISTASRNSFFTWLITTKFPLFRTFKTWKYVVFWYCEAWYIFFGKYLVKLLKKTIACNSLTKVWCWTDWLRKWQIYWKSMVVITLLIPIVLGWILCLLDILALLYLICGLLQSYCLSIYVMHWPTWLTIAVWFLSYDVYGCYHMIKIAVEFRNCWF